MRVFFSILLLLSFSIRPVVEISNVMYYQLNIDTIIEKYCVNKARPKLNCNGKCYLMKQIKQQTADNTTSTNKLILITEAFVPLFFQENTFNITNTILLTLNTQKIWKAKDLLLQGVSKDIDHPPKIVVA
ncbi:hypothetical protein [Aquimarina pacifica]|uniref:hypothetical protein n=1 Tax=Aquimarina pacifica TaxID=1296415 RepID=UPI000471B192|nr:hypothetical protein [Aquimarina pacifica]